MIKIKNNLISKYTNRYILSILGRNLIKIFSEISNLETLRGPRLEAAAVNLYLRDKGGKIILEKQ